VTPRIAAADGFWTQSRYVLDTPGRALALVAFLLDRAVDWLQGLVSDVAETGVVTGPADAARDPGHERDEAANAAAVRRVLALGGGVLSRGREDRRACERDR